MLRWSFQLGLVAAAACIMLTGCANRRTAGAIEPTESTPQQASDSAHDTTAWSAETGQPATTAAAAPAEPAAQPDTADSTPASRPAVRTASGAPLDQRVLQLPDQPGTIQPDILLVNQQVLRVAEVLYALRDQLRQARRTQTDEGFRNLALRWIERETRTQVGALLVYDKALARLSDSQSEYVEKRIDELLEGRITADFGGSRARLEQHLAEYGMTIDQFRDLMKRELLVRQYTHELLSPKVYVRRDELYDYYRDHAADYDHAATRELLMIAAPFDAFLPDGVSWEAATQSVRAAARLKALRHIRAAHEALQTRPFDEVAREFSKGIRADAGGSWGQIGRPLQRPYDEVTARIFDYDEGQVSEPVEGPEGWYIVGCGEIERGHHDAFADVQAGIRETLLNEKFNRLANEYVVGLAEKATISSFDHFVQVALMRAFQQFPAEP